MSVSRVDLRFLINDRLAQTVQLDKPTLHKQKQSKTGLEDV